MFLLKLLGFNPGPIRAIESAGIHLGWGWAGLILLLLALVPLIWWSYRCEGKNVASKQRRLLLGLRLTWVVLLAVLLTGPVLIISGWIPQKNRLAVMIDTSRSMSIKSQGETRLERVKKLFARGFIGKIEEKTGIFPEVFSFADNVSPVSRQEIEQFNFLPEGNQTDISGALRNVMGNLGEGSLLGVIMLTDGVNTTGENPLTALSNMRTPVYMVAPGADGESPDMALHLPKPPALGYLNSSLRVRGEVSLHRLATSAVEVTITRDGEPFATTTASFASDSVRAPFAFNIPCDSEGNFRFELSIPGVADELTADNNTAGFLLKVVRERLNVLAVSGRPTWDMKFIGNALSTDPNAKLTHWARVRDDRWVCARDFMPEKSVSSLSLVEDLKNADVVVLNGVPHQFLRPVEEELIKRLEAGSIGLLLLPSTSSFAELGFSGTALEKVMPVQMGRELWRGNPGNMVLPAMETAYNFLRLVDDPVENLEFFASLPKFDGLYEYGSVKPGAEILVNSTVRGGNDMLPFMLQSRSGQGHVIMITGAPLWPAGFRLVPGD
ncbi:MAG: VWA domain-containing protein [Candidatus Riflebacteria bacterium]|nr:VWA domain-containing protein [Candidatus Riflebacteria bacterium]